MKQKRTKKKQKIVKKKDSVTARAGESSGVVINSGFRALRDQQAVRMPTDLNGATPVAVTAG